MSSLKSGVLQAHAVRLKAGDDLVPALLQAASDAMSRTGTQSAFVMSAVGSLQTVSLRMANAGKKVDGTESLKNEVKDWNERLEIVSLVGTFSVNGKHLHMSISDKIGNVYGGHLMSGKIFTTLELVLGTIGGVSFCREPDESTGFDELVIRQV